MAQSINAFFPVQKNWRHYCACLEMGDKYFLKKRQAIEKKGDYFFQSGFYPPI
jgi:hypothetical protein